MWSNQTICFISPQVYFWRSMNALRSATILKSVGLAPRECWHTRTPALVWDIALVPCCCQCELGACKRQIALLDFQSHTSHPYKDHVPSKDHLGQRKDCRYRRWSSQVRCGTSLGRTWWVWGAGSWYACSIWSISPQVYFWRSMNAELFALLMATNRCLLLKFKFEVSHNRSFPSNSVPWQLAYVCAKLKRKCCFTSSYENKRSLPLIFTCSFSIFSIS